MAKFCSECGTGLSGKAKFCPECGVKLSDSTGKSQAVNVGQDVGGDVNVAGRDIIKAELGELQSCQACNGTGEIEIWENCSGCDGKGYWLESVDRETARELEGYDKNVKIEGFGIRGFKSFLSVMAGNFTSAEEWRTLYSYVHICHKCGGKGPTFLARLDEIRYEPGEENTQAWCWERLLNEGLGTGLEHVGSILEGEMFWMVKIEKIGTGKTLEGMGMCPHCKGQGEVRI